jgi:hypothetical protein
MIIDGVCTCCGEKTDNKVRYSNQGMSNFKSYDLKYRIDTEYTLTKYDVDIPICEKCFSYTEKVTNRINVSRIVYSILSIIFMYIVFIGIPSIEMIVLYNNDRSLFEFSNANARLIARAVFLLPFTVWLFSRAITAKGRILKKKLNKENAEHPYPMGKYYLSKSGELLEKNVVLNKDIKSSKILSMVFNIPIFLIYFVLAVGIISSLIIKK